VTVRGSTEEEVAMEASDIALGYPVAYGDGIEGRGLDQVPDVFWRKLELLYPGREPLVLVYESEAEDVIRDVMLMLQLAAGKGWFRLFVTNSDGVRAEAIGIPS
jgi:hypothetical protein